MRPEKEKETITRREIRTYCAQCFNNCPVVAEIENGEFVRVTPDRKHRFHRPLCPKGHAGPELVSSGQRLEYPMKRTTPKGSGDPGWQRISWNEALDTIARKMNTIKNEHGAEAFAFSQTNVSSPLWEITGFVRRLANLYGTPNHITTTHICNWHRDNGSALTFGKPGDSFSAGWPDFERSKCILIWGHNPRNTMNAFNWQIKTARKNSAKIIVVDPRRTEAAAKADIWLQVNPGADGALALGMIKVMLEHGLYDEDFVRKWTNAPLLVRCDTGDLLRDCDLEPSEEAPGGFYVLESRTKSPVKFEPGKELGHAFDLEAEAEIAAPDGGRIQCKSVFSLLREAVKAYTAEYVEQHTGINGAEVLGAVRMIAGNSPACWFSFNGIEQNLNATQTNRAICILYALTGDYDKPGGNAVNSPLPPLAYPFGFEFITPDMFAKNLAIRQHPLGPAGTLMSVPPYLLCRSIEEGVPYKVRGLIVFGANTVSANPHSKKTADAFKKLDFHVHIEPFLSPTAQLADIVLPSASFWETGRIGYPMAFKGNQWVLQWREPAATPRGQSKDELWIIFELAKRLGHGEQFWGGKIEAAFDAMLQPVGITLRQLKEADGGVFIQGPVAYQKYLKNGFSGMSGRIEIFSQLLKEIGQPPLPLWNDPLAVFADAGINRGEYPFLLINAKLREYCQSQHRALPSLRKRHPHPFVELNKKQALKMGIANGDTVSLETVHGQIFLEAKLTDGLAANVVCTQHGWWQACPELGLPGHDIYSPEGANVNLLYNADHVDPISGSVHMRGFPCNVRKKEG